SKPSSGEAANELLAVRNRLDQVITQLNRLNRISHALLSSSGLDCRLETFAEAIPEVLEMAVGAVWELEAEAVTAMAVHGLQPGEGLLRSIGMELLGLVRTRGLSRAQLLEPAASASLASLNLSDAILCPCLDGEGQVIGLTLAANTTPSSCPDVLRNQQLDVLSQIAERFALHLCDRRNQKQVASQVQKLQESEQRLQQILSATNDGWWDWDLRTDRCLLSSRWVEMLGGHADGPIEQQGFWLDRVHPSQREEFSHCLRRILAGEADHTLVQEVELVRNDGTALPVLVRGSTSTGNDGATVRFSGTILDLTERRKHEAHVRHLAFYDDLTDLPNRRRLLDLLPQAITACRGSGQQLALLMIDLDGFKKVNDTHGHAAGDQILRIVGQRLRQGVRQYDLVARLGGDEFVVLMYPIHGNLQTARAAAERVAKGIVNRLSRPYQLDGGMSHHSASVGVALLADQNRTADELMHHADLALYEAKSRGRAKVRLFQPGMELVSTRRALLEGQLRTAMDDGELALHFQAIVNEQGRICGAEALTRWNRSGHPVMSPDQFIPVAEESGLIHQLGDWSLQQIGDVLQRWTDRLDDAFRISMNLSASQFLQPNFVERMLSQLRSNRIDGRRLRLEITEATVLDDLHQAAEHMNRLIEHGIEFSLDDFGTGYTSISYLRALPLAEVKIDKSYVHGFLHNRIDAAILRALMSLSDALGFRLVAEGIENEMQWQRLSKDGCRRFQGFLFSTPAEAGQDPELLLRSRWRQPVPSLSSPA
ncbi:MAG: EAL domain-containing protein, partial [Cyanobacteriota bacterium]|nr:EAL domain-containing protein [Cyanobacteriota bacterium]